MLLKFQFTVCDMIQNDQYNIFLTIWGHSGPIWTLLDHFRQNLIFCLKNRKVLLGHSDLEQKIKFCLKRSKRVQMGPKWPQIVKNVLY